MDTTPVYGWPYPEPGDHTRTWEYWQGQVEAIEATVKARADADAARFARLPHAVAAGAVTTTTANGNLATQFTVTFPAGRFNQPPIVALSTVHIPATSAAQKAYEPFIYALSATAMSVQQNNSVNWTAQFIVHWHAVQMTPTSAPGAVTLPTGEDMTIVTAICHTISCENHGLPIEVAYPSADDPAYIVCGPCGQPITDITPAT
jgi:hypothetical protein